MAKQSEVSNKATRDTNPSEHFAKHDELQLAIREMQGADLGVLTKFAEAFGLEVRIGALDLPAKDFQWLRVPCDKGVMITIRRVWD
jgi:hypothetical protein